MLDPQAFGAGEMQAAMPGAQQNGPQGSNGFAQAMGMLGPQQRAQVTERATGMEPNLWQTGNALQIANATGNPFAAALQGIMERDQAAAQRVMAIDAAAQNRQMQTFLLMSRQAAERGNRTHQALNTMLDNLRPSLQPQDYIRLVSAVAEMRRPDGRPYEAEDVPRLVMGQVRELGLQPRPNVASRGGGGGGGGGMAGGRTLAERDAAAAARVDAQINRPAPAGGGLATPTQNAPAPQINPADRDAYNRHQRRMAQDMRRLGQSGTFMQIGPNGEVTQYDIRDEQLLTTPAGSAEVQRLGATERGLRDAAGTAQQIFADLDRFGAQLLGPVGTVRGLVDSGLAQIGAAASALGINNLSNVSESQATALLGRLQQEAQAAGNNEVAATRARFNANMLSLAIGLARASQGTGTLSNFDVQSQIRALGASGSPEQLRAAVQSQLQVAGRRYDNQLEVVERLRRGQLSGGSSADILRGAGIDTLPPGAPAVPPRDAAPVGPPTESPPAAAAPTPAASILDVRTPEEYAALPSGTRFRAPDGSIRVKP